MQTYRVQLDVFTGPLDLLLYLVERNELETADVPLAKITAQFIEFLEVLEYIDLDAVGDFVVMASSLVEIKSQQLLPRPEENETPEAEGEATRSELVAQLLQYKKFKDAAGALQEQAEIWQERYPRMTADRPRGGKDPSADYIRDVELWDLVSALARVLKTMPQESHAHIRYDDTPISVYIERIAERVRADRQVKFSDFFQGENERSRIVGIFLAILELLRHHSFRAQQPLEYGEIHVLPPLAECTDAEKADIEDTPIFDENAQPQLPDAASERV